MKYEKQSLYEEITEQIFLSKKSPGKVVIKLGKLIFCTECLDDIEDIKIDKIELPINSNLKDALDSFEQKHSRVFYEIWHFDDYVEIFATYNVKSMCSECIEKSFSQRRNK